MARPREVGEGRGRERKFQEETPRGKVPGKEEEGKKETNTPSQPPDKGSQGGLEQGLGQWGYRYLILQGRGTGVALNV